MQFHTTATIYDHMKGVLPGDTKKSTPTFFYDEAIVACEMKGFNKGIPLIESELAWMAKSRPYYKVYPAILDSLCRLKQENYKKLTVQRKNVCSCGTILPENQDICYTCVNEANTPNYDYYDSTLFNENKQ